jgi:uncharacterized protein
MTPENMTELGRKLVTQLLRGYKWAISPMLRPACRFVPTCSEYAMEAVERYGVMRGGMKAVWRLLRCHPLSRGGFDPVVKIAGPGSVQTMTERHGLCSH